MLQRGGNAVDAAIATAAAMTIVEPCSNGLGSDSFCILWDGKQLHGLNASGPAPQAWTPEYFRRKYGGDALHPPLRGIDAVTVPGAVGAWAAMSERFGKLPFADLMAPAVEIAERGYLMPPVVQQKWAAATPLLKDLPGFAQTFLRVTLPVLLPALLTGFGLALARAVGEYGSVIFIAGNLPGVSEIAPLLIVTKLEQYDYGGAAALAVAMMVLAFALLYLINRAQRWSRRWAAV